MCVTHHMSQCDEESQSQTPLITDRDSLPAQNRKIKFSNTHRQHTDTQHRDFERWMTAHTRWKCGKHSQIHVEMLPPDAR